jgi:hypothetical protein
LSSKWQPEKWRYLAWRARCSAFGSRCMECDPFPSPTSTKCSKPACPLGVKWSSVGRGAAPCHWHQGQVTRDLAGWTAPPSEPAQAPRQSPRTIPNPPDAIHDRGVRPCKRWQRVSVRLSGESKHLLWTMSRDHPREVQGTNEHATMLASRKHIKLHSETVKRVYIMRARVAL